MYDMDFTIPFSPKNPPGPIDCEVLYICGYKVPEIAEFYGVSTRTFYYNYPWSSGIAERAKKRADELGLVVPILGKSISKYDDKYYSLPKLYMWKQCGASWSMLLRRTKYPLKQLKQMFIAHSNRLIFFGSSVDYARMRVRQDPVARILGLEERIILPIIKH